MEQLIDTLLMQVESPRNQAKDRSSNPRIRSYLENLGWVQYFHYDMNDSYSDAAFSCQMQIKKKLCQFERFDDDTVLSASLGASVGTFSIYTLLGMEVKYQSDGVPLIQYDHPLTKSPDLSVLKRHSFHSTGDMPRIFKRYDELQTISRGRLSIGFPTWQRGPLDLAIQLRSYERLMEDTIERPQFIHDLMNYIVEERMRWWDAYYKHFNSSHRGAGITDDWLNIPFISPSIFRDFVLPYYLELEKYHGRITRLHSCGNKAPILKLLEELKTLGTHEGNGWTDLETVIRDSSKDKSIDIRLLNTDVLLATKEEMEAKLESIRVLCKGRNYSITASAIEKVHDDFEYDIRQVQMWIEIARRTFRT